MLSSGDVVAVYFDNTPSVYARIEMISSDIKPHWYQIRLLFLSFPPQEATWILREKYLEGSEFTMKDIPIKIIPLSKPSTGETSVQSKHHEKSSTGSVLSFVDFRKKKQGEDPEDTS